MRRESHHALFFRIAQYAVALGAVGIFAFAHSAKAQEDVSDAKSKSSQHSSDLKAPIRLESDGKPIDIGELFFAHAGPCLADVDNDGDRDLLVGDFPGYFWFFENTGTDKAPRYASKGKLQAGGEDTKTPVY